MSAVARRRTDKASRLIRAPAARVYDALTNADALSAWLPPLGMTAELTSFAAREGGSYRMVLTFTGENHRTPSKTSEHSDAVEVRFVELVRDERIVTSVRFKSVDPAYLHPMKMAWVFNQAGGGTQVTITCEAVPAPISAEDHAVGLNASLENLARFTER